MVCKCTSVLIVLPCCVFCSALSENLLMPIQERLEEWKKVANQLEKDHAKGACAAWRQL